MSSVFTGITWLTSLLPWLLLAYVASRPLTEARASGSLELLLSTPLPAEQIIHAHWMGLWRQLRGPVYVSSVLIGLILLFGVAAALTSGAPFEQMTFVVLQVLGCVSRVVTGVAVGRMGLYLGLKASSMFAAVGLNLFYTVIIVWLVNTTASILVASTFSTAANGAATQLIVNFLLSSLAIAYAVFLIHWSRQRLLTQFRSLAAQTAGRTM